MGFHSFANSTQLVLELCLNSSSSSISSMPQNPSKVSINPTFDHHRPFCHQPSLTLALSGDSCGGAGGGSSFSNVSVKREREVASEESERVNTTSGTDDQEDEDGSVNGRKKLRLTKAQSGLLEEAFKFHTTLNPKQKQELARNLKLRPRQVEVWFQNRRARTKLKQTEVDCEYLKKCCERLRDENRRLRQEVEEVKAQKVTSVYMQSSMCPSCQQHTNPKTPLITIPPKPHFFNPFTNSSSAAC